MHALFRSRLALIASAMAGVLLPAWSVRAQLIFEGSIIRSRINVGTPTPPSHSQSLNIQSFPVHTTLTAQVGDAVNASMFDMELNGNFADWRMTPSHRLTGINGFLTSTGGVLIRPSVDSLFSVDAWFNYNHPGTLLGSTDLSTRILIPASGGNPPQVLFSAFDSGGTFGLDPAAGTLAINGSYVLSAGVTYEINFYARTDNYAIPPPGAEWLGNGQLHITINPIPEPSTLALLATAVPFLVRHRKSCDGARP